MKALFTLLCLLAATAFAAAESASPDTPADPEDETFADEFDEDAAPMASDPFEGFNRAMQRFNNTAIRFALRPVADTYEAVVPSVARRGLRSFFDNLRFPVRFVSSVLQGKLGRGGIEATKFFVNTTAGVGGFFDVAGQQGELKAPSEDIGQALGRWGMGPGPYLVLPLLGPSSVRDFAGSLGDSMLSPTQRWVAKGLDWEQRTAYTVANTFHNLPERLRTFDELQRMSLDPYVAMRDGYLQYREAEVRR